MTSITSRCDYVHVKYISETAYVKEGDPDRGDNRKAVCLCQR